MRSRKDLRSRFGIARSDMTRYNDPGFHTCLMYSQNALTPGRLLTYVAKLLIAPSGAQTKSISIRRMLQKSNGETPANSSSSEPEDYLRDLQMDYSVGHLQKPECLSIEPLGREPVKHEGLRNLKIHSSWTLSLSSRRIQNLFSALELCSVPHSLPRLSLFLQ